MCNLNTTNRQQNARTRGSILLMVLVAIVIMSLTTSSYLLFMRNEHLAVRYRGNHLQTELLVQSGAEYLRAWLDQTTNEIEQQGGLIDNPEAMQDVLVIEDEMPGYRGRFTVIAPAMYQGYYEDMRYGLENESAKLNLNSLIVEDSTNSSSSSSSSADSVTPQERLLAIPGMDEAVADAILDWLDNDDTQRINGAESDYYLSLNPPYEPRNGPIRHLDELLMVQGVTPELLYGLDSNRNYMADIDELPYGLLESLDNTNGELDRGWSAYLTVHSLEINATSEGEQKIDLNSDDLQTLHGQLETALGREAANFIIFYRQSGAANSNGPTVQSNSLNPDFGKPAQTQIISILDLIDVIVRAEPLAPAQPQLTESPWKDTASDYRGDFANLLDVASGSSAKLIAGRININQASLPVLLSLPGMTETLADQIVSLRSAELDLTIDDQRHPTWLIAEGLLNREELRPMLPYMTTLGDVYSGQVVGYFEAGTARSRAAILLDRSGETTELVGWQELGGLGPGFSQRELSTLVEDRK